ncbi:NADH oxidase [Mycobacteroides abscessus subsp. abscessus]|nr:NADH oxidase [Mycobacteroides abscessus subsp. abscessus]
MKVLVIGATHAGTFATQQILTEHPDYDVTVYERGLVIMSVILIKCFIPVLKHWLRWVLTCKWSMTFWRLIL